MSKEAEYYIYMSKLHSLLKKLDAKYNLIITNILKNKNPILLITKSEYYFGCYEIQYRYTLNNNINNYIIINYRKIFDSSNSELDLNLIDDEDIKEYQKLHLEIIKINNEVFYKKDYNDAVNKLKILGREYFK